MILVMNKRRKAEIERLTERLEAVTRRRDEARIRREYIRGKLHEGDILRDKLNARINNLEDKYRDTLGNVDSAKRNNVSIAADLDKSMQLNVLNDAFYIWYSGPFGTINNFRIGNVPTKPIEWSEINAALGETALALSVIVSRIPKNQFQFTKFELYPMGSYSKVYKKESSTIFAPMEQQFQYSHRRRCCRTSYPAGRCTHESVHGFECDLFLISKV